MLYMIMKNSGRDVACLVRRVTGEHSFAAIRRSTFKLLSYHQVRLQPRLTHSGHQFFNSVRFTDFGTLKLVRNS